MPPSIENSENLQYGSPSSPGITPTASAVLSRAAETGAASGSIARSDENKREARATTGTNLVCPPDSQYRNPTKLPTFAAPSLPDFGTTRFCTYISIVRSPTGICDAPTSRTPYVAGTFSAVISEASRSTHL